MSKIIFILVLSLSQMAFAKNLVEYKISRVHGLIDFAYSLIDEPHHAPGIKEAFKRSSYGTSEVKNAIEEIRSLRPSLHASFNFNSTVPSRSDGISVDSLIVIQSLFAKNLDELSERVIGFMPLAEHKKFFASLKVLSPVYDKLIWDSSVVSLEAHKKKLDELAVKIRLDEMFKKVEFFYRGKWPEETSFVIGLYAIPLLKDFQNSTNSHSLASIEEHGVMVGAKNDDLLGSFGVIFHELCHSVYGSQTDVFKKDFENYFVTNKSLYKNQAYSWINEALATALGNAWAFERAGGVLSEKDSWYNEPTIDGYAKALYPMVKDYMLNGKVLDKPFVDRAVELYEKTFPQAIYSFDGLMNKANVVFHGRVFTGPKLISQFRDSFRISDMNMSAPFDAPESLEAFKDPNGTLILLMTSKEGEAFAGYARQVPALHPFLDAIKKMPVRSVFAHLDENGRGYLVIKADSEADLTQVFQGMKKERTFQQHKKILTF